MYPIHLYGVHALTLSGFMQITSGAGRVRSAMMVIRRQIRMGRHPGPRTARSMVLAITGDITRNLEDDK